MDERLIDLDWGFDGQCIPARLMLADGMLTLVLADDVERACAWPIARTPDVRELLADTLDVTASEGRSITGEDASAFGVFPQDDGYSLHTVGAWSPDGYEPCLGDRASIETLLATLTDLCALDAPTRMQPLAQTLFGPRPLGAVT